MLIDVKVQIPPGDKCYHSLDENIQESYCKWRMCSDNSRTWCKVFNYIEIIDNKKCDCCMEKTMESELDPSQPKADEGLYEYLCRNMRNENNQRV